MRIERVLSFEGKPLHQTRLFFDSNSKCPITKVVWVTDEIGVLIDIIPVVQDGLRYVVELRTENGEPEILAIHRDCEGWTLADLYNKVLSTFELDPEDWEFM